MSHKLRLQSFANEVKTAGLSGGSMQKKLAEIVAENDLTGHDISRIAEMANRDVQLGLYKSSADKRFKFELADPEPLIKQASKTAADQTEPGDQQKLASAIDEAGGDPFAVPQRSTLPAFSLYQHPMSEKVAFDIESINARQTIQELDRTRLELEGTLNYSQIEVSKVAEKATKSLKSAVQGALDLVMSGVTLPSLYAAVMSSCAGSRASDDAQKNADDLMHMVVSGLKSRGVPNHRMGFRHQGDVAALDRLSAEELLVLCKRSTGRIHEKDVPLPLTKIAVYAERYMDSYPGNQVDRSAEATEFMRSSNPKPPQVCLDDRYVGNLPVRAMNADNEFVIAISDLIGDQSRMLRLHSSQEYIGLKLKQIEQAIRDLTTAHKTAEAEFEVKKAGIGASLSAVAKPIGSALSTVNKGLSSGWGQAGMVAAPIIYNEYKERQARKQQEQPGQMKLQSADERVMERLRNSSSLKGEQKTAFIGAAVGAIGRAAAGAAGVASRAVGSATSAAKALNVGDKINLASTVVQGAQLAGVGGGSRQAAPESTPAGQQTKVLV